MNDATKPAEVGHSSRTRRDQARADILVIGYGNELRSDDALGPRVAAAVAEEQLAGVRALVCHQLTPELAERVAAARAAIFVDAEMEAVSRTLTARRIGPSAWGQFTGHLGDPRLLLALARDVFHRCPPAWWITVPGVNFEFGEKLSPCAESGLAEAVAAVKRLAAGQREHPSLRKFEFEAT